MLHDLEDGCHERAPEPTPDLDRETEQGVADQRCELAHTLRDCQGACGEGAPDGAGKTGNRLGREDAANLPEKEWRKHGVGEEPGGSRELSKLELPRTGVLTHSNSRQAITRFRSSSSLSELAPPASSSSPARTRARRSSDLSIALSSSAAESKPRWRSSSVTSPRIAETRRSTYAVSSGVLGPSSPTSVADSISARLAALGASP